MTRSRKLSSMDQYDDLPVKKYFRRDELRIPDDPFLEFDKEDFEATRPL